MRTRTALVVLMLAAATVNAHAQEGTILGPPAIEAVAAITTSSTAWDDPSLFFDLATTVPIGSRFGAIVRPYAHRLTGGDWEAEMYQLQIRYQSQTRIPVRVDAGIITSPLGLGTLELRSDLSPAIKMPFYYTRPLPAFDPNRTEVQLMSGGYPLGAIVSASGTKWDARGGWTDSSPARPRNVFASDSPRAMSQFVAGGGFTPTAGLRFGTGFAHGAYRYTSTTSITATPEPETPNSVTVFNLEGEYSVGHMRFSGEWVRSRFESSMGPVVARGYFVQAVRTFSPRLFGTVRIVGASTPVYVASRQVRRDMTTAEFSAGYRISHDFTVRGGYYTQRRFGVQDWSHSAITSLVWARRWF
jgi:hypothetical protein